MQRTLITIGVLIALIGLLWPWASKLGLGRLPGDLIIDKPGKTRASQRASYAPRHAARVAAKAATSLRIA